MKNVLSLFDGISAGRVALDRANIIYDKYYASEIDKYAISITQYNYPDTIQLGDVTKWREWDIDWSSIDLLLAGFPCQSWSVAGKQQGDKDPRGKLLWDMLDILTNIRKYNPKVIFLFENVKMKKDFLEYINNAIGVAPIEINSSNLSAQRRRRLYWTNINNITQPEDKKIYLRDVLEKEVEEKYYLSDKIQERLKLYYPDNACYSRVGDIKLPTTTIGQRDNVHGHNQKVEALLATDYKQPKQVLDKQIKIGFFNSGGQGDRVYSIDGKSVTLGANGGGRGALTGLYAVSQRGRNIVDGKRKDYFGALTEQRLETVFSEKSNCLSTVQKDTLVMETDSTLENYRVRKLTPIEAERCQTFSDNYTKYGKNGEGISNSQRYKALGNSWTVDVISHIFSFLENKDKDIPKVKE